MTKFNKIFSKAVDKNVETVEVYLDADNYLCSDSDATNKLTCDEVVDLCKKGKMIVYYEEELYLFPISLEITDQFDDPAAIVLVVKNDAIPCYSKEYVLSD